MVKNSNEKRKYDKRGLKNKIEKCEKIFLMNVQNSIFCETPYEKYQQIKKRENRF